MAPKILPADISKIAKSIFNSPFKDIDDATWIDNETGKITKIPESVEELARANHAERLLSNIEDEKNWLGFYRGMRSPGIIAFNIEKLLGFAWSLIEELLREGLYLNRADAENLFQYCVAKTWHHELFHHFCDVQSFLSGGFRKHRDTEEALAVAYSHLQIDSMDMAYLTHRFICLAYAYRAPGYSDWVNYQTPEQYQMKLIEYLNYPGGVSLLQKGYPLNMLLTDQLEQVTKVRYFKVEWA